MVGFGFSIAHLHPNKIPMNGIVSEMVLPLWWAENQHLYNYKKSVLLK